MVTGPLDPVRQWPTRPEILVLPIIQSTQREIRIFPSGPPIRANKPVDETLHNNGPRVLLPRPAQKRLERADDGFEIGRGHDPGVVDGYTRVLKRVAPALGGDDVGLAPQGFAHVDDAVLDDDGGIAEDEVDGAVDVAWFIELALRVDEEGVLVALETAGVEDGEVGGGPEGDRLAALWTGGVAECDSSGYESDAVDAWNSNPKFDY